MKLHKIVIEVFNGQNCLMLFIAKRYCLKYNKNISIMIRNYSNIAIVVFWVRDIPQKSPILLFIEKTFVIPIFGRPQKCKGT